MTNVPLVSSTCVYDHCVFGVCTPTRTSVPRVSLQCLLFLSPSSKSRDLTHPLSHPTVSYERELHSEIHGTRTSVVYDRSSGLSPPGYSNPFARPVVTFKVSTSHFGVLPTAPAAPRTGKKRPGAGYGFNMIFLSRGPQGGHLGSLNDPRAR